MQSCTVMEVNEALVQQVEEIVAHYATRMEEGLLCSDPCFFDSSDLVATLKLFFEVDIRRRVLALDAAIHRNREDPIWLEATRVAVDIIKWRGLYENWDRLVTSLAYLGHAESFKVAMLAHTQQETIHGIGPARRAQLYEAAIAGGDLDVLRTLQREANGIYTARNAISYVVDN